MRVKDRKALVVGFARSGLAAANFLMRQGASVSITDVKSPGQLEKEIAQLRGPARLSLSGHNESDFQEADFIVLSPGVPLLPELKRAASRGTPILSEVELAYRFLRGRFIGITGSNGKTTTTALIGEILKAAKVDCAVAGNIGTPLISCAESPGGEETLRERTFVVELSSFQLENIRDFKCWIALLLNVTPDHLDRYPTLLDYARAKERIFLNQTRQDYAVLNADNSISMGMAEKCKARVMLFSRRHSLPEGVCVEDGAIHIRWDARDHYLMPATDIRLKGGHNVENVLAAAGAGFLAGVDLASMARVFRYFAGVEHRLEFTRRVRGVDYYNDSKGTNVDSAIQGLQALDQPLVVIMGGKDKGGDFTALRPFIRGKVKLLILIGAAADKIFAALGGDVETVRAADLKNAVDLACSRAAPGDAVLLEPACASFDMFENYEERGKVFKEWVRRLPEGGAAEEGEL